MKDLSFENGEYSMNVFIRSIERKIELGERLAHFPTPLGYFSIPLPPPYHSKLLQIWYMQHSTPLQVEVEIICLGRGLEKIAQKGLVLMMMRKTIVIREMNGKPSSAQLLIAIRPTFLTLGSANISLQVIYVF